MIASLLVSVTLAATPIQNDTVKTNFQTGSPWSEYVDAAQDGVMVYGFGRIGERAATWREKGYTPQFMTGIAWGGYTDFYNGTWDGEKHLEEVAQRDRRGEIIWHGKDNPYIVPTESFLEFMKGNLRKVVDAGITDIFLEEPELWSRCGYGTGFKKEWKAYYGTDWKPQHESAENTYMANKLKHYLYVRAIKELTSDLKRYGKEKGREVRCYIATHSLVNYSAWNIVSPESAIAQIESVDGFIAQVWTGTSRYPNLYENRYKSRIFETALMEYGALKAIALPAGKEMYLLTDPIEDAARDWADYRKGYEATYMAEIMQPEIARYEIMPWPERIYRGKFRTSYEDTVYQSIPADYATQMQIMVNALMTMPVSENRLSGPQGISVLLSNSLMFQRFIEDEDFEDPILSDYFGMVLPLLKRGVPVGSVFMDNLGNPAAMKETGMLLMTYADMKPMEKAHHELLAAWVEQGGTLVFSGRDDDRFQTVTEWWNGEGSRYPSQHLFSAMGLGRNPKEGVYRYGKGTVAVIRNNPREYVMEKGGYGKFLTIVKKLYDKNIGNFTCSNYFKLERGPYDLYSVMDETTDKPLVLSGNWVDMFSADLPVISSKTVMPGTQSMLLNLDRIDRTKPNVIATAARTRVTESEEGRFAFKARGPKGVKAVTRIFLPSRPKSVTVDGKESFEPGNWDEGSSTCLIRYDCNPEETSIEIKY